MMSKIVLYGNTSDKATVYKKLTTLREMDFNMLGECSVENPTIQLTKGDGNIINQCNYSYIPQLGRYYYVVDHSQMSNGLWKLSLKVDPLMTYKESFMNLSATIERQENEYNLYLNDGAFKVYQNDRIQTKAFNESFPTNGSYLVTVA